MHDFNESHGDPAESTSDILRALVRQSAKRILEVALDVEVDGYVNALASVRDARGRRLVVRNGKAKPRTVNTSAGPVELEAPRVNDRRVEHGLRVRFVSEVLPPYVRRSPPAAAALTALYVHALTTGDFRPAIEALLGESACRRLGEGVRKVGLQLAAEHRLSLAGPVSARDYIQLWVGSFAPMLGAETNPWGVLAVAAVRQSQQVELLAAEPGQPELVESWAALFRVLRQRGLHELPPLRGRPRSVVIQALRGHWPADSHSRGPVDARGPGPLGGSASQPPNPSSSALPRHSASSQ